MRGVCFHEKYSRVPLFPTVQTGLYKFRVRCCTLSSPLWYELSHLRMYDVQVISASREDYVQSTNTLNREHADKAKQPVCKLRELRVSWI